MRAHSTQNKPTMMEKNSRCTIGKAEQERAARPESRVALARGAQARGLARTGAEHPGAPSHGEADPLGPVSGPLAWESSGPGPKVPFRLTRASKGWRCSRLGF